MSAWILTDLMYQMLSLGFDDDDDGGISDSRLLQYFLVAHPQDLCIHFVYVHLDGVRGFFCLMELSLMHP